MSVLSFVSLGGPLSHFTLDGPCRTVALGLKLDPTIVDHNDLKNSISREKVGGELQIISSSQEAIYILT